MFSDDYNKGTSTKIVLNLIPKNFAFTTNNLNFPVEFNNCRSNI